jgi:hypothetical protein
VADEVADVNDGPVVVVQVGGLGDVRVRAGAVAEGDVAGRGGGGEHDRRDGFEVVVGLDLGEGLTAVDAGACSGRAGSVRAWGVAVRAFVAPEGQGFGAVGDVVQDAGMLWWEKAFSMRARSPRSSSTMSTCRRGAWVVMAGSFMRRQQGVFAAPDFGCGGRGCFAVYWRCR